MNTHYFKSILVALLLLGCSKQPSPVDFQVIGEQILSDTTVFSKDMLGNIKTFKELQTKGVGRFGLAVLEPQPKLADIIRKYGKPERTTEESKSLQMPVDSKVYWWGRTGLAIPADSSHEEVTWVVIEPPVPH